MKVKFNKEMLLKHRFWILIGITAVLTLVGTFYLQLYGSEAAEKYRKQLSIKVKGSIDAKSNREIIAFLEQKAKEAEKSQSEVWEKAYKDQEVLFRWAPEIETKFEFHKGKFAKEIKILKLVDEKEWP